MLYSSGDLMFSVLLLMSGSSTRMQMNQNKVLLDINGKMVYEYSLDLFKKFDCEIICVINKNDEEFLKDKLKGIKYTIGGNTRSESVYNGLKLVSTDYVLIHDAARPLITKELISNIIKEIDNESGILVYSDVVETIYTKDLNYLDRANLISAKTPQGVPTKILKDSYNKKTQEFTDDISLVKYYNPNINIKLIKSNDNNIKITTKKDLEIIKGLI